MSEDLDQLSDQQLVDALNRGHTAAFDVLYHRHCDWVLRMAWRLTRHETDAQDVLQETFSYLARKFPGFQLTAAMTTFLYPAVRNLSIAARRRRQRSVGNADVTECLMARDESPGQHGDDMTELLSGLSEAHREILMLRFVDDLSQPEIAERLSLALGTVKSRLHHAIRAVRDSPTARRLLQPDD